MINNIKELTDTLLEEINVIRRLNTNALNSPQVKQMNAQIHRQQVDLIKSMKNRYVVVRSAEEAAKQEGDIILSHLNANLLFQKEEKKRLLLLRQRELISNPPSSKHRRLEIQTAVLSYLNFILNCLYLHTQPQIPVSYTQRFVKYNEVDDATLLAATSKFEEENTKVATSSSFDNNFSPVNFISFCLQLYINLIYLYVSITSSSYPRAHPKEISCRSPRKRRIYYRTRKMCNLILDFDTQTFLLKLSSSSLVIFNIFITSHCFYDNNYNYLFDNMHYSSLPSFFYAS